MSKIEFSWSYSDPANPNVYFRLYENDVKVVDNIGELTFSLMMNDKPQGNYVYHVTAVSPATNLESLPSNKVTVNFTQPAAPTGFTASLTL